MKSHILGIYVMTVVCAMTIGVHGGETHLPSTGYHLKAGKDLIKEYRETGDISTLRQAGALLEEVLALEPSNVDAANAFVSYAVCIPVSQSDHLDVLRKAGEYLERTRMQAVVPEISEQLESAEKFIQKTIERREYLMQRRSMEQTSYEKARLEKREQVKRELEAGLTQITSEDIQELASLQEAVLAHSQNAEVHYALAKKCYALSFKGSLAVGNQMRKSGYAAIEEAIRLAPENLSYKHLLFDYYIRWDKRYAEAIQLMTSLPAFNEQESIRRFQWLVNDWKRLQESLAATPDEPFYLKRAVQMAGMPDLIAARMPEVEAWEKELVRAATEQALKRAEENEEWHATEYEEFLP